MKATLIVLTLVAATVVTIAFHNIWNASEEVSESLQVREAEKGSVSFTGKFSVGIAD